MKIGFVGLGRMGMNMVIRLVKAGHGVSVWNRSPGKVREAVKHGAEGTSSVQDLIGKLKAPRVIWVMVPAGRTTDEMIEVIAPNLEWGDTIVDGGNANYKDSIRRADRLIKKGIRFMDAGTSGGVWGLEVGYCLMVGGTAETFKQLEPILKDLAPPDGYMHCGPVGAGHFAKMVHNGIEYGMMQAIGEGFEIMKAAPFKYDLAAIAHLWNQGSVVRSWLIELAERAFKEDPKLDKIHGFVEDSGEGRWTVQQAIDTDVPAPVITLSLLSRFRSRQDDSFQAKVLAALRKQFGGHAVKSKD